LNAIYRWNAHCLIKLGIDLYGGVPGTVFSPSDGCCAVHNLMAHMAPDDTPNFHSSMMYVAVNIHISLYNNHSRVPPPQFSQNNRNPEV
jgi:hypothetical protein